MADHLEKALNLLNDFSIDKSMSNHELEEKYPEASLRKAMEAVLGFSIVHLLRDKDSVSRKSISITDLQTDIRFFMDTIKHSGIPGGN